MRHLYLAAIALTIMVLGAVGCGHSGSSTSSATSANSSSPQITSTATGSPQLGRTALLRTADQICRRVKAQSNLLKVRSAAEFNVALAQVAINQKNLYVALAKLTPPTSLSKQWSQIVANARTLAEGALKASQHGDPRNTPAGRETLATFGQARFQLQATAKQMGLKVCARF